MVTPSSSQLIGSGLWQWLQGTGLERFELLRSGEEWIMRGVILVSGEAGSTEARYELACDEQWHTRRANISLLDGRGERSLEITVADGRWFENGRENQTVQGAVDIDLGWSPSTNTLPIRRLRMEIGQSSGPLTAAWVRFPELTL
ncbi:MAG TPA: putative glycolipid-binding domain-containing protein, partial [Candidatus Angelobacter sp.]|nr:putative glycolipid-binding domain-containing protein [Candidatus Angelobacter sp.]